MQVILLSRASSKPRPRPRFEGAQRKRWVTKTLLLLGFGIASYYGLADVPLLRELIIAVSTQ